MREEGGEERREREAEMRENHNRISTCRFVER